MATPYYRPAILYAGGLALLVGALAVGERLTRRPPPPSVVLITIDALRADRLGIYGHDAATSPNIDALARRGVVFDRAFTVDTLSGPSHASIFTSLYPVTHGLVYNGYALGENATTLAELLRDNGYRTAAFVSDWILDAERGFDQGFEKFELSQVPSHLAGVKLRSTEGRSYNLAQTWLRAMRGQRFFLWLHAYQPHSSYDPPPPWDEPSGASPDYPYRSFETMRRALREGRLTDEDRRRVAALYDGEIAFADDLLAPLLRELERHHERVLIVLTSDHGEFLFEGEPPRVGHGSGKFYEGALRVPLIVVPPAGSGAAGARAPGMVSSIDILPTVAELTGIEATAAIEGRSFAEQLLKPQAAGRERVHAMYVKREENASLALRTETHKLLHRTGGSRRTQLYDLRSDPLEEHDLAASEAELAASLTAELTAWFEARPPRLAGIQRTLSPEVRLLLERGGYLDHDDD